MYLVYKCQQNILFFIQLYAYAGSTLKLDLYDKNNTKKELKIKTLSETMQSRFSHSDCRSSPVKMYMPTSNHCLKKNSGAKWARTRMLLVRAHCAPLFFFQQCSLVGIRIYRRRPTVRMTEALTNQIEYTGFRQDSYL